MTIHKYAQKFFALIAAMALMSACTTLKIQPDVTIGVDATMGTLVTTKWLSQHLNDPDLVVLDCTVRVEMDEVSGFRSVSGLSDYEGGHIPSAGFADLMNNLSDGNSPFQFAVQTIPVWCCTMGVARPGPLESGGCCVGSGSTGRRC